MVRHYRCPTPESSNTHKSNEFIHYRSCTVLKFVCCLTATFSNIHRSVISRVFTRHFSVQYHEHRSTQSVHSIPLKHGILFCNQIFFSASVSKSDIISIKALSKNIFFRNTHCNNVIYYKHNYSFQEFSEAIYLFDTVPGPPPENQLVGSLW